jgi:cell division protein FtsB
MIKNETGDFNDSFVESKKITTIKLQHAKEIEKLNRFIESLEKQINNMKEDERILINAKDDKIDSLNRYIGRLETLLIQNNIAYSKKVSNF